MAVSERPNATALALPRDGVCPLDESSELSSPGLLAAVVFSQMLAATSLAPAIRPFFAMQHGGREGPMHAFMALNMVGAIAMALALASSARVRRAGAAWAPALALLDALLLAAFTLPLATSTLLALRVAEGAAHVALTIVLMSHAAELARATGRRALVTTAGTAIIAAVAAGSVFGGLLVGIDARAPFWGGAVLAAGVAAVLAGRTLKARAAAARQDAEPLAAPRLALWAAFVSRFAIGALVVSFSLYAHRVHGLTDRQVGLLYACLTVPFALSMAPAGALLRHQSNRWALLVGMAAYAGAIAALGHVSKPMLALSMLVAGVASAFVFTAILGAAAEGRTAAQRSRAMALVNAAGCLGMLIGPAAGGIASAIFRSGTDPSRGPRAAFAVAAVALTAWTLVALVATIKATWRAPRRSAG